MSAIESAVTARSRVAATLRMTGVSRMVRTISAAVRRLGEIACDGSADHDLLAHPALRMMSQRELADLPFPRTAVAGNCR